MKDGDFYAIIIFNCGYTPRLEKYRKGELFLDNLKNTVAENLRELRAMSGMTQGELASHINYSDKAVSKWERGESLPDVAVLKQLADMYGVTVDYLLTSEHGAHEVSVDAARLVDKNRFIITLLAVTVVWLVATVAFVFIKLIAPMLRAWPVYVVAIPTSCIVLLVFNSVWGKRKLNFLIISVLVWSLMLCLCLFISFKNIWLIFVIGIPAQVIIALWSRLKSTKLATMIKKNSKSGR